jgi:hypothetical protein
MMRMDPQLTFLKICGPPDEDEIATPKPMNKGDFDLEGDQNSKIDCDDDDSIMSGSKTPSERASRYYFGFFDTTVIIHLAFFFKKVTKN